MGIKDDLTAIGITVPPDFPIDEWAARLTGNPARNALALLGISTLVFYAAERKRNPKVNDIWDALVYTTTCMSVGYADIFARTPVGKVVGSAIMTLGPSMAAKVLDGPASPPDDSVQRETLETLKKILARLEAQPPAPTE